MSFTLAPCHANSKTSKAETLSESEARRMVEMRQEITCTPFSYPKMDTSGLGSFQNTIRLVLRGMD